MMTDSAQMPERQTPLVKPFPAIWPSLGWVVLFLVLQIIFNVIAVAIVVASAGAGRDPMTLIEDMSFVALPTIWSLIVANGVMLGLLWLYLRKDNRVHAIKLDRWSTLSAVKTAGLSVALIALALGFNYAYGEYVVPNVEMQEMLRKLFAAIPDTMPNSILLFAAVALVAPVLEELLFRGLLQNSLAHKLPIWAAIALSALVFGAMHMDIYAMPPLVFMGAVFGIIYHLTGSLRVTIMLHVINNAAALAVG
jgi:uncharacterized protein